ncbi:zf-HC2 domain-containing protein [Cytobacillus spongiae]|jgi:hypothetical protein|uniref:zf-HC2 domain-containing protein n=1 Tax=Cytobacillus spongiae TaxID=2901381 RepID=UPI001F46245C|nr:zf-HC2 domain-containing protein [Cytobacillus spongiae]UII57583.1 zf-HC2 domain-containing protein [Cytobacillus spongiae]
MTKATCEVVRDLLPLYHDDVCSAESKRFVEEHLAGCESCMAELAAIQKQVEVKGPYDEEKKNIGRFADFWNRTKRRAFLKGIGLSALVISFLFLGYFGLFHWNVLTVATEDVVIEDVSQLADGRLVYYTEITDGFRLTQIQYDLDEEGNFYLTPKRPFIKKKSEAPYMLEKGYDTFHIKAQEMNRDGQKIQALYYGTPEDRILIWEDGMDLPAASEEIEREFE